MWFATKDGEAKEKPPISGFNAREGFGWFGTSGYVVEALAEIAEFQCPRGLWLVWD